MYRKNSYQNSELLTGRELEAHVLTKMSNKLRMCKKNWEDKKTLVETLEENLLLWSIFQENLASGDCKQPDGVRLNLLRLINFMDTRTYKIMSNELTEPESLDVLINMNNSIAKGLRSSS
jgi:flagellar biosynthesis activator protein FlaF